MIDQRLITRGQRMYAAQAALEYLISILLTGSFLATITKELGLSDSLTGVLSALTSLGCTFQLLSITIRRTQVKKLVVSFSIINQLLFALLYVIPLTDLSRELKAWLFALFILLAYIIYNLIHPKKINWMMSLLEEHRRGRFTANKEIISLISGMAFSFLMGSVIDYFSEHGQIRTAFTLSAIVIFLLMILHTAAMLRTVEKETVSHPAGNLLQRIKALFADKNVQKVAVVFVLYNISSGISTPFYGTYKISELRLNLKFISAIAMCESISRILVSKFWGQYADKKTFAAMIEKCFLFYGISQIAVILASPANGKIMFIFYHIFRGISMGGINSALINLIYDYVPVEKRADSMAVTQAIAGLSGFLSVLVASPFVSYVQKQGNTLFGIPIYAQQATTALALVFLILTVLYVRVVLIKPAKK